MSNTAQRHRRAARWGNAFEPDKEGDLRYQSPLIHGSPECRGQARYSDTLPAREQGRAVDSAVETRVGWRLVTCRY